PLTPHAVTELCTLSLHDALPISGHFPGSALCVTTGHNNFGLRIFPVYLANHLTCLSVRRVRHRAGIDHHHIRINTCTVTHAADRSEEHTSELQSRVELVCRLRLE